MSSAPTVQKRAACPSNHDLSSLISAVGENSFDSSLVGWLNKLCGAEHSGLLYISSNKLTGWATASIDGSGLNYPDMAVYLEEGLWQRDPSYEVVHAELSAKDHAILRTDIASLPDDKLRNYIYARRGIKGRVLICGRVGDGIVVLGICSSDANFADSNTIQRLEANYETLFALLAKHIDVVRRGTDVSVALTTLEEIEQCVAEQASFVPRREAQVCCRTIYGVSTLGMSLDLGISQETVMTYRKRVYNRLGIATQRELFLWYLRLWSEWRGRTISNCLLH